MELCPWPYIHMHKLLTFPRADIREGGMHVVEPMHNLAAVIHVPGHAPRPG